MERKQKLIALFRLGKQDLEDLAAVLTPEQRAQEGTADNWAIKDILGHIGHWQRVACQDLAGVSREPVTDENIDRLNAAIFEERRRWPWDRIWAEAQGSSSELLDRLQDVSEEALDAPDPLSGTAGRPFWRKLLGDGYSHNLIHLTNWYAQNGQKERGLALMLQGMELLKELDESPEWQGNSEYNMACQYALSGDKGKALPKLAEALRLNPGLTDWSRKDPDLVCLRDEPAYLALYGEAQRG